MAGAPLRGQPFRRTDWAALRGRPFRCRAALRGQPFRCSAPLGGQPFRRSRGHGGTNGDNVDAQLQTLIDLQGFDGKIAGLESEAARLPRQIEALQTALAEAKKAVETNKTKVDSTRKDLRAKEKDLEVANVKRQKLEAKLYEVKTNKEYSDVLLEIEEAKQEKAKTEEDILGLMEMQERLGAEIKEAEQRFKTREEQARQDEAVVRKKLAAVEQELSGQRAERRTRASALPAGLL